MKVFYKYLSSAVLIFLPQILAQAQDCGTHDVVYSNASGTSTTFEPWKLPFGTYDENSGTWVWTVDTASYNMEGPNGSVEQRLSLSTQPQLDLLGPDFGFLGCGMIMHGLRHSTIENGQHDDGSCKSVFSAGCLRALDDSANTTAQGLSSSTLVGTGSNENGPSALDICRSMANLGPNGIFGLPDECSDSFLDNAWIQTFVFASPQANDICPVDPGASDVSEPLASWGAGTYTTADMTTYENLTSSVTPFMVTLLTNRTVNNTQASQDFTGQQLMCLRPSKVQAGSVAPTQIPNAGSRMELVPSWAIIFTILSLLFCFPLD